MANRKLATEREKRGWTQEGLARRSGIKTKRIRRIEIANDPHPEEREKLCEIFGLDAETLGIAPKKPKMHGRKTFLQNRANNISPTDRILEASDIESSTIMNIKDRTNGRNRGMRRGS